MFVGHWIEALNVIKLPTSYLEKVRVEVSYLVIEIEDFQRCVRGKAFYMKTELKCVLSIN